MTKLPPVQDTNGTGHLPFLLVLFVRLPCNLSCFSTVRMDDFFFPSYHFCFQSFRLKDKTYVVRDIRLLWSQNAPLKIHWARDVTIEIRTQAKHFLIPTVFCFPTILKKRPIQKALLAGEQQKPTQGSNSSVIQPCQFKVVLRIQGGDAWLQMLARIQDVSEVQEHRTIAGISLWHMKENGTMVHAQSKLTKLGWFQPMPYEQ